MIHGIAAAERQTVRDSWNPTLLAKLLSFLVQLKAGFFVRAGRYRLPAGPRDLHVEATNACNLACPFCARTTVMQRKVGFLDTGLFRKIAAQAKTIGVRSCHFAVFGEPLMHPRIVELVHIGKQAGIRHVWISSNGSFLSLDKVEKLARAGLDELQICVDGADAVTHENLRVGSSYEKVVRQLTDCADYLRNNPGHGFGLHIQMIVMETNKDQADAFLAFWRNVLRGVPRARASLKMYTSFAKQTRFQKIPWENGGIHFKVPCFRLGSELAIFWDGRVAACCYDADGKMPVGDLTKDSLVDMWNNGQMNRLRDLHARRDLKSLELCKNCDVVNRVLNPLSLSRQD